MKYYQNLLIAFVLIGLPAFSQTKTELSQERIEEKVDTIQEKLAALSIENWIDFSKEEKSNYLRLKAEEIVLLLGPGFYDESQKIIINKDVVVKTGESRNDALLGKKVYEVNFQNAPDEKNSKNYAAIVTFLKSSGKAYHISFSNMMGLWFGEESPYELFKNGVKIKNETEGLKSAPGFNLQAHTDSLIQENRKRRDIQLKKEKARDQIFLKSYDAIIGNYNYKPVKTFPPSQRNDILIAMARKLILKREPYSYHGFHETPEIEYVELNENNFPAMVSKNFGKMAYRVSFYQDSDKKDIDYIVYILEETGQKYLLNNIDWLELRQ